MRNGMRILVVLIACGLAFAGTQSARKAGQPAENPALDSRKSGTSVHHTLADIRRSREGRHLDEVLVTQDFESGEMPPTDWSRIVYNMGSPTYTWHISSLDPFEGNNNAQVLYAEDITLQDEWLISPAMDFSAASGPVQASFAWNMSYYWAVNPYDNYDLELRISLDGGATWEPDALWSEDSVGVFNNYEWYEAEVSLADYATDDNVKIAFRYHGTDGAQGGVDLVVVETIGPVGSLGGTITNSTTHVPLAGAAVSIEGTALTTLSAANGSYFFETVPVGSYTVNCELTSYLPWTQDNVAITENDTTTLDIEMDAIGGELVIDEDFEEVDAGQLPEGWTQVDVDGGSTADPSVPGLSIWQVYDQAGLPAHSGTHMCGNHYNDGQLPNDDWLILPQQNLTGTITLDYWIATHQADYPESYEVRVSTTGSQPADFTDIIYTGTNIPAQYIEHTHDLSEYVDAPFYIAFHYISTDRFVIKLDDVQLRGTPLAAGDVPQAIPMQFLFDGNYPNPFNAQTQFRFSLERTGAAQLILYNVIGQEAARVVDGVMTAGQHTVSFDANSLPSGLYFARLTAGSHSAVQKMMLLK